MFANLNLWSEFMGRRFAMKKLATLGIVFLLSQVFEAQATESFYYRYGDSNATPAAVGAEATYAHQQAPNSPYMPSQQVIVQQPTMVQQPAPAPHVAQYGFYRQQPSQAVRPQYIIGGNPYATPYRPSANNQNSYYSSPVFMKDASQRAKKLYYAGARLGLASTSTKKSGSAIKPMLGLFIGTWADNNIRLDAEFDYHAKSSLKQKTTYHQYELGANVYYDFPVTQSGWQPFVGAGLWTVKTKTTKHNGATSSSSSNLRLALSASAGAAYPINEYLTFSAMLRGRYLITGESIYNIEGLVGVSYAW